MSAMLARERGQASVELVGLLLLCVSPSRALARRSARLVDGRSLGGFLAHHIVCAATRRLPRDGARRSSARTATRRGRRVRELAPNLVYERGERQLPVDWRECRRPRCANAPDDPALDAH